MRKNVSNFVIVAKRPKRSSVTPAVTSGMPVDDDRVRSALERLREWRERGSPDEEIDYSDAPRTTAEDWREAERAGFSFDKAARARR